MSCVDHQNHLKSLLEQKEKIANEIENKKNLLFKVIGAIEYLQEIGVTLNSSEEEIKELEKETEVVSE